MGFDLHGLQYTKKAMPKRTHTTGMTKANIDTSADVRPSGEIDVGNVVRKGVGKGMGEGVGEVVDVEVLSKTAAKSAGR